MVLAKFLEVQIQGHVESFLCNCGLDVHILCVRFYHNRVDWFTKFRRVLALIIFGIGTGRTLGVAFAFFAILIDNDTGLVALPPKIGWWKMLHILAGIIATVGLSDKGY